MPAEQPVPIRRRREVVVFANGFGQLFDDEVCAPDGTAGRYLRWQWRAHGVLTVPRQGDSLALVPAYRYPAGKVFLEFPRGAVEPGEDLVVAALRELREESGLIATSAEVLGTIHADTGIIESAVSVLVADIEASGPHRAEPFESVTAPHWLTRREFAETVARGEVQCGLTLAAAALLWSRRDR
ncbi:MAG TPA: NUDIX hydrolase [Micromonosporaceae bacterium]|jgi:8-oxo-dGTP pyrophosphatase MutT (NUDIX family)